MKEFRGLELDRFQKEAIKSIENNHSVVVSAATGTGKTLIADYVIDKYLNKDKQIVYTAPIKALSNQKYSDFKKQYGEEKVGILTGDVTINPEAPLRIMTTEIYRNMLLAKDPAIKDVAYTIFDEIHYLGDIERGTVWEESLIFSDDHIRFLCLSATIPNAKQLANWISHIKHHEVDVVLEKKRAVPLENHFYDIEYGFKSLDELKKLKKQDKRSMKNTPKKDKRRLIKNLQSLKNNAHLGLVKDLKNQNKLPCIYFCFSRDQTMRKASSLSGKNDFLNKDEMVKVKQVVRDSLKDADQSVLELETTRTLRSCLSKGVAFHHAGLLPALKEIVENLFGQGLVKCMFATETFAVGINMPAKTVCFDSLEKYDGINFRYLQSKEFFQLAGRAGRRGLDDKGYVISVLEKNMTDIDKVEHMTSEDKDALVSQFKLSYNTILNLIHRHTPEEQKTILMSNFYAYQQTGRKSATRILNSFSNKKKKLKKENYIIETHDGEELTDKGLFGMKIYTEELLVSEIFCSKREYTPEEILLLVGGIVYEDKKNVKFKINQRHISDNVMNKLNQTTKGYFRNKPLFVLESFLISWYKGCEFSELLDLTTMPEGDIVRFIRQILDLLQQIWRASNDEDLKHKLDFIKEKIDRDVISVRF